MMVGDTVSQGTPISDIAVIVELIMGVKNLVGVMMGASVIISTIEVARIILDLFCPKTRNLWLPIELSRFNLCSSARVAYSKNKCANPKGILSSYDFRIHTCDT